MGSVRAPPRAPAGVQVFTGKEERLLPLLIIIIHNNSNDNDNNNYNNNNCNSINNKKKSTRYNPVAIPIGQMPSHFFASLQNSMRLDI